MPDYLSPRYGHLLIGTIINVCKAPDTGLAQGVKVMNVARRNFRGFVGPRGIKKTA